MFVGCVGCVVSEPTSENNALSALNTLLNTISQNPDRPTSSNSIPDSRDDLLKTIQTTLHNQTDKQTWDSVDDKQNRHDLIDTTVTAIRNSLSKDSSISSDSEDNRDDIRHFAHKLQRIAYGYLHNTTSELYPNEHAILADDTFWKIYRELYSQSQSEDIVRWIVSTDLGPMGTKGVIGEYNDLNWNNLTDDNISTIAHWYVDVNTDPHPLNVEFREWTESSNTHFKPPIEQKLETIFHPDNS